MNKWFSKGFHLALALMALDVVSFYLITLAVHEIRLDFDYTISLLPLTGIILLCLFLLYIFNTYQLYKRPNPTTISIRTFASVFAAGLILASILYTTDVTDRTTVFWRGNMPLTLFCFALAVATLRFFIAKFYNAHSEPTHWVFISPTPNTYEIIAEVENTHTHEHFSVVQQNDVDLLLQNPELYQGRKVHGIIIGNRNELSAERIQELMHKRLSGLAVYTLEAFCEIHLSKIPVLVLGNSYFVFSNGFSLVHHDIALKIKRLLDILLSSFALVVLSPLMFIVAIVSKIISPRSKIVYSQLRCSMHQKPFKIYKFQTMVENAENDGVQWSAENDPRVTPFGRILRRTRIDELPQLWNVLKGEMSFIGPRPERPEFVEMLESEIPYYDIRHIVKPGLTGWAQVMYPYGRNKIDAIKKLEYDLYYIKNYSLSLDFYILLKTLKSVALRPGS